MRFLKFTERYKRATRIRDRRAPTPAASLGVAMPRYRTPKTQAINTAKGITFVNTPKRCFQE